MHSGCITAHDHTTLSTFLQKMNVNSKDICVSLGNKEETGQEKLEETTKSRQFNSYLHNFIQFYTFYTLMLKIVIDYTPKQSGRE